MTDDSTRGTEDGPRPTDDDRATTPDTSGHGGHSWKKSPSIWPEPIRPAQRPNLWSPEARRTGPIPTATTPLVAETGTTPTERIPEAATGPGPSESEEPSSAPASGEPTPGVEATPSTHSESGGTIESGSTGSGPDEPAPPEETAEPAPPEKTAESGDSGQALSYTGLFKAISDDDLAAADAAGPGHQPATDPGDATAPFDVLSEFTAERPGQVTSGSVAPSAPVGPPGPPGPPGDPYADGSRARRHPGGHDGGGDDHGGGDDGGGDDDGGRGGTGDATGRPGGHGRGRSFNSRRALIVAGAVAGVLAVGYGAAYAVAGDSLARGATVAGIDIGGLTRDEARTTLHEQLPGVVDAPMSVTVDGDEATYELIPSSIGLSVDVDATIDRVPGASANPVSLVRALVGAGATTPVVAIDENRVTTAIADVASQSDTEPVNGSVAFSDGEVVTSEPAAGRRLDTEAAVAALTAAFYGEDSDGEAPQTAVVFPTIVVEPDVGADAVEAAVTGFAEPAMSGPVTVVAGDESVDLSPSVISQALSMTPDDAGTLQPVLDPDALAEAASDDLEELGQDGKDATVVIENGRPVVVEAEAGRAIAPEALSEAVLPALTSQGDDRRVEVELTESDPEVTTEAAKELGIKQVVGEFTTHFPPARYRDVNIGTAAKRIDNTLLLPGEEFSLNGIVGERTEANGFTSGTIIDGGRLEEAMGGGVSQVATTTFHAAFQAGLEDVEHWPHSIYFDRYPIGQEATVVWGAKDMRFRNDTPYGVLVDTSFTPSAGRSQGTLTVRIWSTKYYEVSTSVSDRYAFTSPQTIYDTSDKCQAQGGSQGFSIDSFRTVTLLDGTVDKDEKTSWTYNPNHKVVCGEEPKKPGDGGDDDN